MNAEDELQSRREVRAAVFRTARLRRAGRVPEADEQLAAELAGAQARLATFGESDPAATIRRWHLEDDAAFAIAELIGEFVAETLQPDTRAGAAAAPRAPHPPRAFPAPDTGVPGLADLLDEMLARERRPRPS